MTIILLLATDLNKLDGPPRGAHGQLPDDVFWKRTKMAAFLHTLKNLVLICRAYCRVGKLSKFVSG